MCRNESESGERIDNSLSAPLEITPDATMKLVAEVLLRCATAAEAPFIARGNPGLCSAT
jgi:hypothetical protein